MQKRVPIITKHDSLGIMKYMYNRFICTGTEKCFWQAHTRLIAVNKYTVSAASIFPRQSGTESRERISISCGSWHFYCSALQFFSKRGGEMNTVTRKRNIVWVCFSQRESVKRSHLWWHANREVRVIKQWMSLSSMKLYNRVELSRSLNFSRFVKICPQSVTDENNSRRIVWVDNIYMQVAFETG